jgi:TatD DNase family protein
MESIGWTDTHAHLADSELFSDLQGVLVQAIEHDVRRIVCVAVDADSLDTIDNIHRQAEAFGSQSPSLWSSVGIHPNYAHQEKPGDWEKIVSKASQPGVCAIGETGLDEYWDDCPIEVQRVNFQRHWKLSRETDLPVIIHSRQCDARMLEFLEQEYRNGPLQGVMHSFCSSYDMASRCIDMGLYISFSGMLTYKKNNELREVASRLPLERLLVETDAPYLSPEPKRSTRPNQPAYVCYTGMVLSELHGRSASEIASATTGNALKLFTRMA